MIGIILANTGSPASCDPDDIEVYLREYLMDDRIRQMPKPLWKWLMYKRVLPKRKYASAKRYEFIWGQGGSPLVVNQAELACGVQQLFDAEGSDVVVRSAMSYGSPNLREALVDLRDLAVDHVVLLPLYPQSAYSPTLAVVDAFWRAQEAIGWHPECSIIDNYHDNASYIAAIAQSVRAAGFDAQTDRLVFSFHAIPLKDERAGDTYRAQIGHTVELVARELGIVPDAITVSFQSVFGRDASKWTSPLSRDVLRSWRDESFRVVYACPGFSIDCLETLYDIPFEMVPALEGDSAAPIAVRSSGNVQETCNTAGRFVWVPSLNVSEAHARVLKDVLDRNLGKRALVRESVC